MLPRLRRALLLAAIPLAGLLLLSCGGQEKTAETPVAAQPTGGGTPGAQKVPGVTDTEILLGTHMPLSQTPAAAYAPVADAMRAYFDYVNSKGGVYGRKIRLLVGDDHYNPADTVEVVRKLVEQDERLRHSGRPG